MIFTLLFDEGNFVLSRNFSRQSIGDLHWLDKNYNFSNIYKYIDEMVILNVSNNRTKSNKKKFIFSIKYLSENCFMPISAGGGIDSLEEAKEMLENGADKIIINSNLIKGNLIKKLAHAFGRQCVVGSLDFKKINKEKHAIFINNGQNRIKNLINDYIKKIDPKLVGELLINSMDKDGTGTGLDFKILKYFKKNKIPLIFQGGVGNSKHFIEGLKNKNIQAVSTANLLNFVDDGIKQARIKILQQKINIPSR